MPALLAFYKNIYKRNFTAVRGCAEPLSGRPARATASADMRAPPRSQECGPATKGHYKELMAKFPLVVEAFLNLDVRYQAAIAEVTQKMGAGMAEFISKEVVTLADYNKYCYYVAGLVGVGLSRLFTAGGLEAPEFARDADKGEKGLSNGMGLFLQKTNIIRDYLEDIQEEPAPRMFWPRCVWSKYAPRLADFAEPEKSEAAVACLNHLVTNAMAHSLDSLEYLSKLKDPQVFRFCAIPQVMAIATLAACYDNPQVFRSVVKIPRPSSARIMVTTRRFPDVLRAFAAHSRQLSSKVRPSDPNASGMRAALAGLDKALRKYEKALPPSERPGPMAHIMSLLYALLVLFVALMLAGGAYQVNKWRSS